MSAPSSAPRLTPPEVPVELGDQWRTLRRAATVVCLLATPAVFVWLYERDNVPLGWSIVLTIAAAGAFRGGLDLVFRRFIPWPTLFGAKDPRLAEEDVLNRRRAWFWRSVFRFAWLVALFVTAVFLVQRLLGEDNITWWGTATSIVDGFGAAISNRTFWTQAIFVFFLFIANFLIFLGPMMLMGISQIRGYEPGDATWGVKLEDVRGQAEAKEEVRRIVDLWQSGELFEKAGGKRERGLLFLGAPGTGKTMLAKAIATGFNSPIVTIPGSGFAQTFIGIDALIVRWLAHKAKKLARQVGRPVHRLHRRDRRRRHAAPGAARRLDDSRWRADLLRAVGRAQLRAATSIVESAAWREYLFTLRAPESRSPYPPWMRKFGNILNQGAFPGMMGGGQGQLALNQLLVDDGRHRQPAVLAPHLHEPDEHDPRRDATSSRAGSARSRCGSRTPRPTGNQIYFIGATNVPIDDLDPGADAAGAHGPPRLVPDADEGRPQGHLRPLPRPGQPRSRARPSAAPRRDRADHERLLAGDDRADLLDGADERPPRGQACVRVAAPRRRDDDGRVGNGRRRALRRSTRRVRSRSTRPATPPTAHVYRPDLESSRLSIRMRGGSLGHHQSFEKEERFSQWQSEEMGDLVHTLGAMAAEHAFYGENSSGVGGDLEHATHARGDHGRRGRHGADTDRRSTAREWTTRARRRRASGS